MRCAITLAYDGTSYLGSQIQKETKNTILGQFEMVLSKLGINSRVVASGRTDKGVHASGQVCHVDLPHFWDDLLKLNRVLNEMMPNSIVVKDIKKVDEDFHARYSARKRVYRYIIIAGELDPFLSRFATFVNEFHYDDIEKKIALFVGEHNFENFMKTGSDVQSTIRIIYKAFVYKYKGMFILNFEANGFLRSQIRMMVGALLQLDAVSIKEQLSGIQKHKIRPAASNGLYLAKIKYDT